MLVVTRNENDRIVFPQLGISVEVIQLNRSKVKLGVQAPRSVRIVRHELIEGEQSVELSEKSAIDVATNLVKHEVANNLNRAMLKLQLAARMLESGDSDQGLERLTAGIAELNALEQGHQLPAPQPVVSQQSSVVCQSDSYKSRQLNVLIVDDDANERSLMASYLRHRGLGVRQACDGLEALYTLSNEDKPDVVLLDMNMPRMDGMTTVKRIRTCSQHRDVPVFAVTGQTASDCGIEIGEGGVTGWFQKPIEAEQIVSAIQSCFESSTKLTANNVSNPNVVSV